MNYTSRRLFYDFLKKEVHTVRNLVVVERRRQAVERFLNYLDEAEFGKSLSRVTEGEITRYIEEKEHPFGREHALRSLKRFFAFVTDVKEIMLDPTARITCAPEPEEEDL